MTRLLCLLSLLFLPLSALAELPAALTKDFAPLEGYVVMPMNDNELLIDLDAADGIHPGDIFSIVHQGEAIVHPVSGEVIGSLDNSVAFLQVTRIKSGYSYVRKLSGSAAIAKGDRIRRFEAVPASFTDTGADLNLKSELHINLPHLDWQLADSGPAPLIVFERSANALVVKSSDGTTLFSYPMPTATTVAPQTASAPAATTTIAPAALGTAATTATPTAEGILRSQNQTSQVWHGQAQDDEAVGLVIDDLDNDGLQETLLLLHKSLVVSRYQAGQRTRIAELEVRKNLVPLGLDSLDLNGNGKPEIFLSAVKEGTPASCVYELESGKLTEIACDLPMLFRRIEEPKIGALLLGQKRHDLKTPFSGRPFQVTLSAGTYQMGTDYPLPLPANLYGFTPFGTAQGEILFAFLNSSDYLTIVDAKGERKFESPDRFGGSENRFDLAADSNSDIPQAYFLPQRILVADSEILALQNDGQRMTQRWRQYNKSRLVSLSWNGLSLDENWRTSDQSGQTADFAVADIDNDGQQEVVLAVKFARKGFLSKAKSALVVYETH